MYIYSSSFLFLSVRVASKRIKPSTLACNTHHNNERNSHVRRYCQPRPHPGEPEPGHDGTPARPEQPHPPQGHPVLDGHGRARGNHLRHPVRGTAVNYQGERYRYMSGFLVFLAVIVLAGMTLVYALISLVCWVVATILACLARPKPLPAESKPKKP